MSAISFNDCPHGCKNGRLLNYKTKRMEECSFCKEKRKLLVKEGSEIITDEGSYSDIGAYLGLEGLYLTERLDYESVIPEGERIWIEDDSLGSQRDDLEDLYQILSLGKLPDRSWCFGIGQKGRAEKIAYPLLVKAYINGLNVYKYVGNLEYCRKVLLQSEDVDSFLKSDFLVMHVIDGCDKASISSAKGLMQSRAMHGKPTVFITNWSIEACSTLLGYSGDSASLFMAEPSFVKYKSSGKSSKYIDQITGVSNDMKGMGVSLDEL